MTVMLLSLYHCGLQMQRRKKLFTGATILTLALFTVIEGLRYGRNIDYNLYGRQYEEFFETGKTYQDFGFYIIEKLLIEMGLSWHFCVMLCAFLFILSLVFLFRNYRSLAPIALPLYVLISLSATENMIRWYTAFSFFLFGLSYQIENFGIKKVHPYYIVYSIIACSIHYAFIPVPFVFLLLSIPNKPLCHPAFSIMIYIFLTFLSGSNFMLQFSKYALLLSTLSEKYQQYGDDAAFWLTQGYGGREVSSFPGILTIFLLVGYVILGYYISIRSEKKIVYIYNLFLIGFFLKPLALRIELIERYCEVFYFFQALVLASVIRLKTHTTSQILLYRNIICLVLFLTLFKTYVYIPLNSNPKKYLYVWNKGNETYDSMIGMWEKEAEKE